jgi:WD40 repeat protein
VKDISGGPRGLVATASDDRTAHVYNLQTGQLVQSLQGHATAVNVALFSPDGQTLLTASTDGQVRTWSTTTWHGTVLQGRRPPEIGAVHSGAINGARFSPDSRWIVTAGPSAPGIWQTRTGDLLYFIRGQGSAVRAVTFARDNRLMLTAGGNGTIRAYRCDLCGELPTLQKLARNRLAVAARGR